MVHVVPTILTIFQPNVDRAIHYNTPMTMISVPFNVYHFDMGRVTCMFAAQRYNGEQGSIASSKPNDMNRMCHEHEEANRKQDGIIHKIYGVGFSTCPCCDYVLRGKLR